jgi:hypothetical protein
MYDVTQALERRYGWRVTYEDAPLEHPDELKDITSAVYKAAHPDLADRTLIPSAKPFTFSWAGLGQAPDRRAIVDQCIVEHNSSGNPGGFGSLHRGDVSHVFPVAVRSVNGSVTPVRPALDAIVDFPQARRTVLDTISLILRQAGNQTGTPIVVGTVSGMRTNQLIWLEARQIAARDALLLALNAQQAINMEAGLPRVPTSWAMLYQADQKTYYFNLHAVWVTAGPTPTVAAPRN